MTMLLMFLSLIFAQPAITASDAWLTETAAGGTAVAGLTLTNPTMYDIYVVEVRCDAAGKIELRDGDKAVKVITVPSFGFAELTAAGPHVLLMDVKRALKAGDVVDLVIETDGGIVLKLSATVKKP